MPTAPFDTTVRIEPPPEASEREYTATAAVIAETERVRAAMTRDYFDEARVAEYLNVANVLSCSELYPPTIKGNPSPAEYKRIASAQAYAKIARGVELGIGPSVSMSEIEIIEGKPQLSSALMACLIRRSARYDFREITCTPEKAEIEFTRDGVALGRCQFSIKDAQRAQLDGKANWRRYPEDMCWWRAMSKGAKRHCPDVFGGAVYAPGEIRDAAAEAEAMAPASELDADAKRAAAKRKTARSEAISASLKSDAPEDTPDDDGGVADASDTPADEPPDTDADSPDAQGQAAENDAPENAPEKPREYEPAQKMVIGVFDAQRLSGPNDMVLDEIAEFVMSKNLDRRTLERSVSGATDDGVLDVPKLLKSLKGKKKRQTEAATVPAGERGE